MAKYREIFVDAIIVLAAVAVDFIIHTNTHIYILAPVKNISNKSYNYVLPTT